MALKIFLPTATELVEKTRYATQSMYAWMRDVTKGMTAGGGPAPADAAYVTYAADATLTAERVATSSATVTVNTATANVIKWDAVNTGTVTHTAGALTLNELVLGNGGADIKVVAATNGQIPIGKTSDGTVTLATLTAGTGITITNGAASITIDAAVSADYVVMSDGANPPNPIDDGNGNFIYVTYTP